MKLKLLFFSAIFLSWLFGYYVGRPTQRELRQQYERGVHLVAKYEGYFGYLPSRWFRDAAFEWGDPQNQADFDSIESIVNWEIVHKKRYEMPEDMYNAEINALKREGKLK